jgi:Flp pilus assembly protein TadG
MLALFAKSEDGAALVEMTIVSSLLFTLVLGFVDFGNAFYQWNAATKAVQVGARLAAISEPVAAGLAAAAPTSVPGAPVQPGAYTAFVCQVTAGTGACSSGGFTAAAFSRIFRGDTAVTNDNACPALAANQRPGMCHFFPRLTRENVVVTYTATGLGFQTRLGGPVPTITVSLRNVTFQFFFLQGLMNFANITMPSMLSTVTGEDMKNGP